MRYITDTDFLPDVKDVSFDVYQLLYGVAVNGVETKIYDLVISLCRKYREPLLRNAKITAWKQATSDVIATLVGFEDEKGTEVYIPYVSLHCTISHLTNLYRFALNVLEQVYGLDMKVLVRRNNAKPEDVKDFYPIAKMSDLMRDFADKCREDSGLGEQAALAVEEEMARRGFGEQVSSFSGENRYQKIFFKGAVLPIITYEQQDEANSKQDVGEEYMVKVGYLYYALKHYMAAVKPQATKERVAKMTEDAVVRIANGLFKPNEPFSASDKGSDTFYHYAHYRKFNDVSTEAKAQNYKEIVRRLRKFKISEPDEPLKEAKK